MTTTLTRTKPASVETSTIRARGGTLKTIRLVCACGVALTYCADIETFRSERKWTCYRCGEKYFLDS